jgi:uncharacterized protein with PQ loop repeat
LLKILINQSAEGVALISWISYSFIAMIWCVYGIIHKEKPIIFMNIALMVTHVVIITGLLLYK